jgi:hypothetical protein
VFLSAEVAKEFTQKTQKMNVDAAWVIQCFSACSTVFFWHFALNCI